MNTPEIINEDAEAVDVETLHEHPRNPRLGSIAYIRESIKDNGFYGALVVQKSTRNILVGNHRYRAAVELGFEKLPVHWVDVDDERALRIMLADNRTSDVATLDGVQVAELLEELQATDEGLAGTAYDDDALDAILDSMEDWERDLGGEDGQGEGDQVEAEVKVYCHPDDLEDVADAIVEAVEGFEVEVVS